jgi:hypothetical protein
VAGRIGTFLYKIIIIYYILFSSEYKIGGNLMKNFNKKSVALLLCSIFLISIFVPATAMDTEKEPASSTENEDNIQKIIEKYEEFLGNYDEISNYFDSFYNDENESENESALKIYEDVSIVSWGRGFHFKSRLKIKLVIINRLLEKFLPWNRPQFNRPWVFCNYKNDSKSNTLILKAKGTNETVKINGSHLVLMHRFVGFTTWLGKFELSPIDLFPRFVIGKAKYVIIYKQ